MHAIARLICLLQIVVGCAGLIYAALLASVDLGMGGLIALFPLGMLTSGAFVLRRLRRENDPDQ